jgi:hypothetical protein
MQDHQILAVVSEAVLSPGDLVVLPEIISTNSAMTVLSDLQSQLLVEYLSMTLLCLITRSRDGDGDIFYSILDMFENIDDAVALDGVRVVGEALELSACLRESARELSECRGSGGRHCRS